MGATDEQLLQRITEGGDAEAFSLVVSRYADLVYSACARVLRDETRAADAVQETFFELFKHAACVRGCLGGWLHRVATRRAIDHIRSEEARRRRESAYAETCQHTGSSWSDVESALDEALDSLEDEAREFLTLHYLRQQTMGQIAASKGISQPTVSRRVAHALECLRAALKKRGVAVGVVPLQTILVHGTQLAPEPLIFKLGKMALAQAASAHSPAAGVAAGLGTGTKVFLAAGISAICIIGVFLGASDSGPVSSSPLPKPPGRSASATAKEFAVAGALEAGSGIKPSQSEAAEALAQSPPPKTLTQPAVTPIYRPITPVTASAPPAATPAARGPGATSGVAQPGPVFVPPVYLPPQVRRPPNFRAPVPAPAPQGPRGYLTVTRNPVPPARYVGGYGGGGGASVQLRLQQQPDPNRGAKRTRVR